MNAVQLGSGSVGVDVGGTFTDVVFTGAEGTIRAKSPTTHADVGQGVLQALEVIAAQSGLSVDELLQHVERFGLGTTAVTNVVASLQGTPVGLITTAGFEDELNLARGIRVSHGNWVETPATVVPRRSIVGVAERVDRLGIVLKPLNVDDVVAAAQRLVTERNVQALAVSFMNAYRNTSHEQRAVEALAKSFPDIPVVSGSGLSPTPGYFQRTLFAVLNAFAIKSFAGIHQLGETLASRAPARPAPLRLVSGTGGAISVGAAAATPMVLLQSGPAAGVAAAAAVALGTDAPRAIACDMGGTSFDVSIIDDGTPERKLNAEILNMPTSLSMVDVESIGAGGGSLAWIDSRSMLRVGPRSAGSEPGPACYGRGGTQATVTDALVVLGHIDPDHFLGGTMKLDAAAATEACARLGEALTMSADEVAYGIRQLALADMGRAVRLLLNMRGLDPTEYSVVSYGGCGSLFTTDIARMLAIPRVIVPEVASVLSAFGAATAPVRRERVKPMTLDFPVDPAAFESALEELRSAANDDLAGDLVPESERTITFEADLRFRRQKFELSIRVPEGVDTASALETITREFTAEYQKRYGQGSILLGMTVELVLLRAVGVGQGVAHEVPVATGKAGEAHVVSPTGSRLVLLEPDEPRISIPVYNRTSFVPGCRIDGPALIDAVDTTIWVPPGCIASADEAGSLLIDVIHHTDGL